MTTVMMIERAKVRPALHRSMETYVHPSFLQGSSSVYGLRTLSVACVLLWHGVGWLFYSGNYFVNFIVVIP